MIACALMLCLADPGAEADGLPRSLAEDSADARTAAAPSAQGDKADGDLGRGDEKPFAFSIGPRVGYIKTRDADRGTWLVGVQARMRLLKYLGLEAAIGYHQDEFLDGDVRLHTYPVELSGLVYLFPDLSFELYGLAGVGWYYTRYTYHDDLSAFDDETDSQFGVHVGAGASIDLGPSVSLNGDFRWIFLDEPGVDNSDLEDEEFDRWQITAGLNFGF